MDFLSALNKRGCKLLISGCSTAYNRYSYDPEPRMNATDCGVGMGSWSFRLRDRIITSDPQFIYGGDIEFSCDGVSGIDNDSKVPNTAMFEEKIKTLFPKNNVSFTVSLCGDECVLYLQRRMDSFCYFDIAIDGETVKKDISTQGLLEDYAGYGLMQIIIPCDHQKKEHTVCFENIRGENPKITVAGVGAKNIQISMSGKGAQTTQFFLDNFDERIGNHKPDILLFTLGANDRIKYAPEVFRQNLTELLNKIFDCSPNCKMLYLLPPAGHDPKNPELDYTGDTVYTSLLTMEVYDRVIKQVCEQFGKDRVDTLSMRELFSSMDVSQWRYDNIHMNRYGNDLLFDAVARRLGLM